MSSVGFQRLELSLRFFTSKSSVGIFRSISECWTPNFFGLKLKWEFPNAPKCEHKFKHVTIWLTENPVETIEKKTINLLFIMGSPIFVVEISFRWSTVAITMVKNSHQTSGKDTASLAV